MQNNLANSSGRMENPYLATPALLGLSQHTAGFSEALRMSRTFAHQVAESKDYGGAFGGPLSLRALEFPSPLLLSSPFLYAGMEPRLPFGGSAFHPVTSAAAAAAVFERKFFAPPKLAEAKGESSGEYGEVSSTAPARRPQDDDERTSGSERSSPESGRLLKKRALSPADPSTCPVCGAALRPGEVAEHCRTEVERLLTLTGAGRQRRDRDGLGWETYHRVRGNRQVRLRCKTRKRRGDDGLDCCAPEQADGVRLMLPAKRVATVTSVTTADVRQPTVEDEEVDVLGDADCNSSDWGRQRDGGTADQRTGMDATGSSPKYQDVDATRGSPSYQDVEADAARGGLSYQDGVPDTTVEKNSTSSFSGTVSPLTAELERLRTQLTTLERESSRCRCGVCGQTYRQPLVSTHCWHVHCTQCWNTALGGDRRCPRCSAQVGTENLNAIHV